MASTLLLLVIIVMLVAMACKMYGDKKKASSATDVEATPETSTAVSDKNVKVESAGGISTVAKLAHVLAVLVSGAIALAVGTVLADGTSVILVKDPQYLPIITNPTLKSIGFNHRVDELLGPTYGIGLHHDQSGATWTELRAGDDLKTLEANLGLHVIAGALPSVIASDDLKHPVPFLKCDALKMAGLCAVSFGFIAEVVAVLMILFHALALTGLLPTKIVKGVSGLVWLTLTAGFLIVVLLAVGIYTATWTCDNTIIPSIKISDHFDYNYGFAFAIIGFLSSLLMFCTQLTMTSTKENDASPNLKGAALKTTGGVVVGCVTAAVLAIIVCASNGGFADPPPLDPAINPCEGKKPKNADFNGGYSVSGDNYFANVDCMKDTLTAVLEQAGANVTAGYVGGMDAGDRVPITAHYSETDLCPVNVHWHLGAEHLSVGEYDPAGTGPPHPQDADYSGRRSLAAASGVNPLYPEANGAPNYGHKCHHYSSSDPKFTTPYNWQHCTDTEVGETYEVHWPHSAAGACGTPWQYQTPFYDGVFCRDGIITIAPLNTYEKIGVQGQVFTIVNDESFYYDNLIDGMVVDSSKNMGTDMAYYTGSTTGTSRNNHVCSRYAPITWQVDRKCHMISASSFDKLCMDMKAMKDDMSGDIHPHGARDTSAHHLVANNQQRE